MRPLPVPTLLVAFALSGCLYLPKDKKGQDGGGGADGADGADGGDDGADTDDPDQAYIDHCGAINANETWSVDILPHRLKCPVDVVAGTLTIEAGVEIYAADGSELAVGEADQKAGLVIEGTASNPVRFIPESGDAGPGSWSGIALGQNAEASSIRGLVIENAGLRSLGGALYLDLAETVSVQVENLKISGAAGCGLTLRRGEGLADGSGDIRISETEGPPACVKAWNAHTLPGPADGGSYDSPTTPYIEVSGDVLAESATWEDLGLPYGVVDTFNVGRPGDPAVLTIGPGVTVAFEVDEGLELSSDTNASGLVANGTEEAPVTFTALGAKEPGAWVGIVARRGVDAEHFVLQHTTIEYAGRRKVGLLVENARLMAEYLSVLHSAKAGIGFQGTGGFQDGSHHVTSTGHAEEPLYLDANAVGSIPNTGLEITGNGLDIVRVIGENEVRTSATWHDLALDYVLESELDVSGTSTAPTVLTIESGTRLLFNGNSARLALGPEGQSGIVLGGMDCATSSEPPVYFGPYSSAQPGAWGGVQFYWDHDDSLSCFGNFEVEYAGGTGAIRVTGSAAVFKEVTLSNGEINGLYDGALGEPETCPVWANIYANAIIENVTHDHVLGWMPEDGCVAPASF